jgi:fimbrial isopeptide formation D2 family protein
LTATKEVKLIKPDGSTGTETFTGDKLEYTITAENSVASAQWNNILFEDTLSEDLDYLLGTGKVYVDGKAVEQAAINLDSNNKLTVTTGKSIKGKGKIVVKFDALVKPSAKGKEITNTAILSGKSEDNLVYPVKTNDVVNPGGTVKASGSLALLSVPDVNFGILTVSGSTIAKEIPASYENDLMINDDRGTVKDVWHVTVKQTKALTSADGRTVLTDAIHFRKASGAALTGLEGGNAEAVHEHTPKEAFGVLEVVKPTTSWHQQTDDVGFYFKLNQHVKKGQYTGELTWTLHDTPSN